VPIGLVIATEPPAGTEVETGSFVVVVESAGIEEFTVPPVIGETEAVARSRIEAQGFEIGTVTYELTETEVEGVVIDQSPEGGTLQPPGTEVDLKVSKGPLSLEVPDVSGMTADHAIVTLTREGFENILTEEEFSLDELEGRVIRTDPEAGMVVPRDRTVTVFVSLGPEPVAVPDFTGMTEPEARQEANSLGLLLVVSSDRVEVPLDSGLIDRIAAQQPGAGETLEVGDEVTVQLGIVRTVTVPNFDSLTLSEAQSAGALEGVVVQQAGEIEVADLNMVGRVVDQNPPPGTSVDEGTVVGVFIGKAPPTTTTTTTTTTTVPTTTTSTTTTTAAPS
jgi:serine/threonine-protein kinase